MAKTTAKAEAIKYVNFKYENGVISVINEKVAKKFEARGAGEIIGEAPVEDEKEKAATDTGMTKEEKYKLVKDSGVESLKPIAEMDEKLLDQMIKELGL